MLIRLILIISAALLPTIIIKLIPRSQRVVDFLKLYSKNLITILRFTSIIGIIALFSSYELLEKRIFILSLFSLFLSCFSISLSQYIKANIISKESIKNLR